jgi:lipoprotein-releasing system permease protein
LFRPLAANIGMRYAVSRRSFISFISTVAISGLVLSVAVLLIVTSVMNGFERELRERVLGVVPHLTLHGSQPIRDWQGLASNARAVPGVTGAAPFIQGAGLVAVGQQSIGVSITGIAPGLHPQVSDVAAYVENGGLDSLVPGDFGVLIGARVAERLGLVVGDSVTLVLPEASVSLAGLTPRQKRVTVTGLIDTRSELDGRSVYLHIEDAARLFRLGDRVHGLQLRTEDLFAVGAMAERLRAMPHDEPFRLTSWMRMHGNLYQAIGFQRATMFLLLSLLVGVAAFNLVSSLIMVVNQRQGDVAILRTLGAGNRTILGTFIMLGSLVGLLGVGLGIGLGLLGAYLIQDGYLWLEQQFGWNLMSQYFVTYLPSEVRLADVLTVAIVALGLCVLSTLYPAWRAARLKPADVLRYE